MKSIERKMTKHNQRKIDFIAAKKQEQQTIFVHNIICISRKVLHLDLSNSVSLYILKLNAREKNNTKNIYLLFLVRYSYIEMLEKETDFHPKAHTNTHTFTYVHATCVISNIYRIYAHEVETNTRRNSHAHTYTHNSNVII